MAAPLGPSNRGVPNPGSEMHSRIVDFLDRTESGGEESAAPTQEEADGQAILDAEADAQADTESDTEETETAQAAETSEETSDSEADTEAGETTSPDEPDPSAYTLSALAGHLEMSEDDFLAHIEVDAPDGSKTNLKRVLDGFRAEPETAQTRDEVALNRMALQQEREQLQAERQQGLQALHAATAMLNNELVAEEQSIDWKQLEQDDPQEYTRLRIKMQDKRDKVRQGVEEIERQVQIRNQEESKLRDNYRFEEVRHLQRKMPTWKEPTVAKKAMGQVETFLKESGFSEEEIAGLEDHRMVLVAFQASEFHRMKQDQPAQLKKLRDLPKPPLKAGARPEEDAEKTAKRKRAEARMAQLRKTGSHRDAAKLFEELL